MLGIPNALQEKAPPLLYHSPLTTHHSPLTTHHSPLTTHHSPGEATHHPTDAASKKSPSQTCRSRGHRREATWSGGVWHGLSSRCRAWPASGGRRGPRST